MSTSELELSPAPRPPRTAHSLVRRLHFYAGVLVAPFILVAAISGGLYAISPTLERVVYSHLLHVDTSGPARPVADQIDVAQRWLPDLTPAAVRPAAEPGETTTVLFTDPRLGESEQRAVFVDPVAGVAVGESVVYGSTDALPMRTWIDQLHRNLHLGEPGRLYSELAASWLWVVVLGGLYLWVRRGRRRIATVDRGLRGRARTLNWHGVTGLWIAAGLLFLSATGMTWSTYAGANVDTVRSALNWQTPTLGTGLGHEGHSAAATTEGGADPSRIDPSRIDTVLTIAKANGVDGAVEVGLPARSGTAYTVTQVRQAWQFSPDAIAIDGATGRVVDVLRFADWPLAAKLTSLGIAAHMGILFGLANQLVLLALAIALVTMIVRGYRMWWQRRPVRDTGWGVGRPPERGAARRTPLAVVAPVAVAALVAGWFAPLLGLSLLGFLVLDTVVGVMQQRRNTAAGRT